MSDDLSGDMLAPSWPNLVLLVFSQVANFRYVANFRFRTLPPKKKPKLSEMHFRSAFYECCLVIWSITYIFWGLLHCPQLHSVVLLCSQ